MAQLVAGEPGITVQDLLRMASQEHPSVTGARFGLEGAKSQTQAARFQFFPSPSVSSDSLDGKNAVVFRLTQPLWTGGKLTADLERAEVGESRASAQIDQARMAIGLRLMAALQSYFQFIARAAAQEKSVHILADLSEMIRRRGEAGVSSQADLSLMASRLAQATSDLEFFRGGVETSRGRIRELVGRDLYLQPLADDVPAAALPGLEEVRARVRETNPNIRLAAADERIAKVDIDRARSAMWPTVSLRAERQTGQYLGSQAPGNRVFLSIQYAPGAGLGVFSQIESAQKAALAAEQQQESVRRDELEKAEAEYRDFDAGLRRQPGLARARDESARVLESNRRLFVGGRRSWIDLLNSARELVQSEQAESDVRATLVGSYYRLALLTGALAW